MKYEVHHHHIEIPTINCRKLNIDWGIIKQNKCTHLCKSGTSEYMEPRSLSTIPPQLIMGEVIEVNDKYVVAKCYNEYYGWIRQLVEYGTRVKPIVQTSQIIGDYFEPLIEDIYDNIQYTITGYELVYLGEFLGIYS